MQEFRQEQQRQTVVVTETAAAANFVTSTLAVNGIQASMVALDQAFPSINWAQGHRVLVAEEDAEWARRLLADLQRNDVVVHHEDDPRQPEGDDNPGADEGTE